MQNLDSTIIVTALPAMARSFGLREIDLSIGITVYMMALAAFVPLGGWLADRFGTRRVFAGAILLFTLASLFCAFAPNLGAFVAARLVQGIGGALMMPVGRLVVLRSTPNSSLIRAMATITWPGLVAPVLGPALGGFIATYASWHWIFLLNVPIGLVGAALVMRVIPNDRGEPTPFDVIGFLLSASSLMCAIYALEAFGQRDQWLLASSLLAVGVMLGILAVRYLTRVPKPLISFAPLRSPIFVLTSLGSGAIVRTSIGVVPFLLPLMFQLTFGLNAFEAGSLVLAYFAGNLAMKSVTTPLLKRFGFRTVLTVNGILSALSILALAALGPETSLALILAVLFFGGLARSMEFTSLNTLGFVDVPASERASATTLWSMSQQISNCLGVALGSLLLAASLSFRGTETLAISDFRLAFIVTGLVCFVAALRFFSLDKNAGSEISGKMSG